LKKLNLAKVRSAIRKGTIALVVLAWLPRGTSVGELASAGFSPGVMSAGLGTVPPSQTYLDIGQGNRIFDSLYDDEGLPPLPRSVNANQVSGQGVGKLDCRGWERGVDARAESAPAEIEPFLLRDEVRAHDIGVSYGARPSCVFGGPSGSKEGTISGGALRFEEADLAQARRAVRSLGPRDLLIAIARPTGADDDPLPIGIAGHGFGGDLTSDSTRIDGYVLSTDVAPTILGHFGIAVPSAMSGQPIRAEGSVDPAAIESLTARMVAISSRRGPVIGFSLLVWLGLLALVAALSRGRLARVGVRLVGLAVVVLPTVLLIGSAIKPAQTAELLLVALGAPLLAGLVLGLLGGYRALGAAAGVTVGVYAIDMVAGSPLTSLSLLGPNPGLGVRFYGIGNELEALLAVLIVAGTGAALAGFAPRSTPKASAIAFLAVGIGTAFVFAAGRFGADVGAAIVFPIGAAVAAATVAARRRRTALLVIAAPLAMLALLALIDLVTGANAHLTRSVLDAGGLSDLADVAQRRLQLSAHSFTRSIVFVFLPLILALTALAYVRRERLRAWLRGRPAMRAGLIGAAVTTVAGTLANDSGALLLEIGAAYLLVFVAYAWAEAPGGAGR
jgi:hypothetical protein